MATPIKPKRTFTSGKVPTTADLQDGEMGINVPDGRIYVRQGSNIELVGAKEQGVVQQIIGSSSVDTLGISVTGLQEAPQLSLTYPNGIPSTHVFAGPPVGGASPQFRALTSADIPKLPSDKTYFPEDYISGLQISTTPTSIIISAGAAYVPSVNGIVHFSGSTITSSTARNTIYHLYLTSYGTVVRSTTAPGAPYYLTARRQGTTNSTRYIGSVATDQLYNYVKQGMGPSTNLVQVAFLNNTNLNTLVSNGAATSPTDVSAAAWAPLTAVALRLRIQESSTTSAGVIRIYAWDGSSHVVWSNLPFASTYVINDVPCDSTPKIQYDVSDVNRRAWFYILGYTYER